VGDVSAVNNTRATMTKNNKTACKFSFVKMERIIFIVAEIISFGLIFLQTAPYRDELLVDCPNG
jgi:hypothetical protein